MNTSKPSREIFLAGNQVLQTHTFSNPPLNPALPLLLPNPLPLLPRQPLQPLKIAPASLKPLRINIPNGQIRADIRLLRTQPILHRPAQSQEFPEVRAEPRYLEVFVPRRSQQFHVVQGGAWVDGVDAARDVVFVPAAAGVFPDGVFDPFLQRLVCVCFFSCLFSRGRATSGIGNVVSLGLLGRAR